MKKWFQSKTIWFNAVLFVVPLVVDGLTSLSLPPDVLAAVVAIGNVILRIVTNASIEK